VIGFWKAPLLYRNPAGRLRYGKRYTNRKQRLALAKSHMKNHLNPAKQKRKRRYKKDGAKNAFCAVFFCRKQVSRRFSADHSFPPDGRRKGAYKIPVIVIAETISAASRSFSSSGLHIGTQIPHS